MITGRAALDATVIVPFFRAERYIARCLGGLLAQDFPAERFEILLVDNNSPDGSAEIVRRFPRVRLLRETKQGAYAARNRAAADARGEVLVFTDPDCVPQPQWLSRLLECFAQSEVQVAVGRVDPGGTSSALRLLANYDHEKSSYVLASDDPAVYTGHTNNMAIRREAFDAFGPFVERQRGADTIFVRRTAEARGCQAIVYAPHARVEHLEIDGLGVYLRKLFTYGRSRRSYRSIMRVRRLTPRERLRVAARTLRSERFPPVSAAMLLGLLALGVGYFRAGALAARWSPAANDPGVPAPSTR